MNTQRHYGWMWIQACEVLDHAEKLQRQFLRYTGPGVDAAVWEPPVDVHETADGLSLQFALPGVAAEQIEVTVEPNALTVSARRPLRFAMATLSSAASRFLMAISCDGSSCQDECRSPKRAS